MPRGTEEITDDEMQAIIMACLDGASEGWVAEDEVMAFVDWCEERRFDWTIVQLVMSGHVLVRRAVDGEWIFTSRNAAVDA